MSEEYDVPSSSFLIGPFHVAPGEDAWRGSMADLQLLVFELIEMLGQKEVERLFDDFDDFLPLES